MKFSKVASVIVLPAVLFLLFSQAGTGKEVSGTKTIKAEGKPKTEITGTWNGKGVDSRGVVWEFTFKLTQKGEAVEGTSAWKGSDGSSATGAMKGTIDLARKTFMLKDVGLDNAVGDVLLAIYTGSFSADFNKMTGEWTIPGGGSPGKFEAAREK